MLIIGSYYIGISEFLQTAGPGFGPAKKNGPRPYFYLRL